MGFVLKKESGVDRMAAARARPLLYFFFLFLAACLICFFIEGPVLTTKERKNIGISRVSFTMLTCSSSSLTVPGQSHSMSPNPRRPPQSPTLNKNATLTICRGRVTLFFPSICDQ